MKNQSGPSKLTWSWTGWFWGVQVVTGDSQEEVIIFRDRQTDRHTLHHNTYIVIVIIIVIIIPISVFIVAFCALGLLVHYADFEHKHEC